MPDWIEAGFNEYQKRMPRSARVDLVEVKPAPRSTGKAVERWLESEAARIREALPSRCFKVVLDERGAALTTSELAQRISGWQHEGRDVGFIIGGADGTHPQVKKDADLLLALSAFTLPHGLCRVLLAEQLYRATSLLAHHPYHRE